MKYKQIEEFFLTEGDISHKHIIQNVLYDFRKRVKEAICKNQKLLVHSDTCGCSVNESQRPVARARAPV